MHYSYNSTIFYPVSRRVIALSKRENNGKYYRIITQLFILSEHQNIKLMLSWYNLEKMNFFFFAILFLYVIQFFLICFFVSCFKRIILMFDIQKQLLLLLLILLQS